MISGVINILKPAGITSNFVLTKLKKKFNISKIGHFGTLDPSGTGVLPVAVGKATKLFDLYLKKDKEYRAIFIFGKLTDTLDSDGKIEFEDNSIVSLEDIKSVLPKLIGKQAQMPPKYSAKKVNGQNAYQLARNGVEFELKTKDIEIYSIDVLEKISQNTFLFDIKCSSGTYIRSIARDMASMLGTYAYMGAIIRIKSGNFVIENSIGLNDVTMNDLISLEKVLQDRKKVFVCDEFYDKIINGCDVIVDEKNLKDCVVFCKKELIGIANINNGILHLQTNLREKND